MKIYQETVDGELKKILIASNEKEQQEIEKCYDGFCDDRCNFEEITNKFQNFNTYAIRKIAKEIVKQTEFLEE